MTTTLKILPLPEEKEVRLHFIPAEIQNDGPANVASYFESTIRPGTNNEEMTASLRGRPLHGNKFQVPSGYTEEEIRTVPVKGTDVAVNSVTLQDGSGKAEVSLWRDAMNIDVHAGNYIEVTDVVVNVYKNGTSLTRTGRSKVQKMEAVVEERLVTVMEVIVQEGTAELLTEDGKIVAVPA